MITTRTPHTVTSPPNAAQFTATKALQDITHYIAGQYELDHRLPNQDSRRILFAKQLELLAAIHPDYAAWRKAEIDTILQQHPYRDSAA